MRIVIKVGTNVLADDSGRLVESRFTNIAKDINGLIKQGHKVILVTSGAVAAGKNAYPDLNSTEFRKVLAAIGQPFLMHLYTQAFKKVGLTIGQCLISRSDIANRQQYHNAVSIIEDFLSANVIPVLNENDVFADESLNFGDNDSLAAMFAIAISADKHLILTNQEGLLSGDPPTDSTSKSIPVETRVDKEIERLCSKEASASGKGGMIRKVKAAQQAVFAGITTHVADGRQEGTINKIINGEEIGTRFIASKVHELSEQKRWLLAAKGFGQVIIDQGAASALRQGKSLLFPGLLAARGLFEPGSIIEVVSDGDILAYGRVNFSENFLHQALSLKDKRESVLDLIDKEVIHCDYMIVLKR